MPAGAARIGAAASLGAVLVLLQPGSAPRAAEPSWTYRVRAGDTIWDLAQRYLVDPTAWQYLVELNEVREPRLLPPGSVVRLPLRLLRAAPGRVDVVEVAGQAQQRPAPGRPPAPLRPGDALPAGTLVTTGADSSVLLRFFDGATIRLESSSQLELTRLVAYPDAGAADSRVRLVGGRITGDVDAARGRGSTLDVGTEAAVTAVRGTRFRVAESGGTARSLTEVERGRVAVSGSGRTVTVPAGRGVVSELGRGPGPPEALLPAPAAAAIPSRYDRHPLIVPAPERPAAVAWRLRVLPIGATLPLFDAVLAGPELRGPDLPDGRYRLALRGVAPSGLEGQERETEIELDARPDPPVPLEPAPGGRTRAPRPSFGWAVPDDATGYRLQLASEPSFAQPILDASPAGPGFVLPEDLPAGTWFWRIATISGEDQGPFGDPVSFERLEPPPAGTVEPPEIGERELVLRTRAGPEGQRYRFELARDRGFRETVFAQTSDLPEVTLRRPLPGRYWLRVRQIEPDGYEGEWSAPQRFDVPATAWWPAVTIPALLALLAILL